jgi:hypothetical protein
MNIRRFRASLNFLHSISSLRLAIAGIGSEGRCGSPHSTVDHVAGRDQTLARLHGLYEAPMIMTASRHIGGTLTAVQPHPVPLRLLDRRWRMVGGRAIAAVLSPTGQPSGGSSQNGGPRTPQAARTITPASRQTLLGQGAAGASVVGRLNGSRRWLVIDDPFRTEQPPR